MSDGSELLSKRVYFAARDGLPITLYALLAERTPQEQAQLLNQVVQFRQLSIFLFQPGSGRLISY